MLVVHEGEQIKHEDVNTENRDDNMNEEEQQDNDYDNKVAIKNYNDDKDRRHAEDVYYETQEGQDEAVLVATDQRSLHGAFKAEDRESLDGSGGKSSHPFLKNRSRRRQHPFLNFTWIPVLTAYPSCPKRPPVLVI